MCPPSGHSIQGLMCPHHHYSIFLIQISYTREKKNAKLGKKGVKNMLSKFPAKASLHYQHLHATASLYCCYYHVTVLYVRSFRILSIHEYVRVYTHGFSKFPQKKTKKQNNKKTSKQVLFYYRIFKFLN